MIEARVSYSDPNFRKIRRSPKMPTITPRKCVVEIQFPPDLGFFSKFDAIASSLMSQSGSDFPDWRRTHRSIELMNRQTHRRLLLEPTKVYFEKEDSLESPDESDILLMEKAASELNTKKVLRAGYREWYAIELGSRKEDTLIEKMISLFSFREQFEQSTGLKSKDVAYTLEYESEDGRRTSKIILGAMGRQQWESFVPYLSIQSHTHLGETESDARHAMQGILDSLPDAFVFVDIDQGFRSLPEEEKGENPSNDLPEFVSFLRSVREKNRAILRKLVESLGSAK